MRVINQNYETIIQYDLTAGKLIPITVVKEDAEPIDRIKKIVWTEDDFEEVQMYIPHPVKTAAEQIKELKTQLSATDYKVIKCSECQLLGVEMPYDVAALHQERQAIRDRINQLEQEETP